MRYFGENVRLTLVSFGLVLVLASPFSDMMIVVDERCGFFRKIYCEGRWDLLQSGSTTGL